MEPSTAQAGRGKEPFPWLQKSHAAGNFSTQAKITSRWALLNLLCRGGRGGAEQTIQTSTKRFGNSRSQCPVALARRECASFEHSAPPFQGKQQTGGTARSLHAGAHPLCHTISNSVETTHPFDFNAQVLFNEVEIVVLQAVIKG